MAHPATGALARVAALVFIAALSSGCATRYNAQGHEIYVWQFGQNVSRDVDYTNPRMPILPRWAPNTDLWPTPSPYEFNDLSRWSMLKCGASKHIGTASPWYSTLQGSRRSTLPAPGCLKG